MRRLIAKSQDSSILGRFTIPLAQVVTQSSPSYCAKLAFLQVSPGIISVLHLFQAISSPSSEKAMAPQSSTLAWKIPQMEEPGRLQSMRSLRVGTRLSDFTFTFHFHALEKEMAIHSSVFAWRIPGMGEPGGLPSVGSHRVRHD